MEDIAPSLLEKIQKDFKEQFNKNKIIAGLYQKVRDGTATYVEANEFAIEVGEMLARAYKNNISSSVLPDGHMYYNIAKRLISPTMENNYNLITEVTNQIQTSLNKAANIGIKAITPEMNQDRINGIINKLDGVVRYDDVAWVLDEPIVNFSQSIVDDSIRANAEFHGKAGLEPRIIRSVAGDCCEWCKAVAGKYIYPDVPKDVYRRHQRCRCIVEYFPRDGKVQNVHTKKWRTQDESDIINLRKTIGLSKEFDTSKCKHNLDGTLYVSRAVERKLPNDTKPFEVIDVISSNGNVSRTIYDENARRAIRIDTTDHGFPKAHPMGAHKHIITYDDEGNHLEDGIPKVLSRKDRRENADIL